jgi:uncharacterized membrane protein
VEIALKALSPGINDPHTAVHCLNIIGLLLRDLANIKKGYLVFKNEEDNGFVAYEAYDYEVLLYDAYNQIILYGQTDASIMITLMKSLRLAKTGSMNENSQIIDNYAKWLHQKLEKIGYDSLDKSKIEKEYEDLLSVNPLLTIRQE